MNKRMAIHKEGAVALAVERGDKTPLDMVGRPDGLWTGRPKFSHFAVQSIGLFCEQPGARRSK